MLSIDKSIPHGNIVWFDFTIPKRSFSFLKIKKICRMGRNRHRYVRTTKLLIYTELTSWFDLKLTFHSDSALVSKPKVNLTQIFTRIRWPNYIFSTFYYFRKISLLSAQPKPLLNDSFSRYFSELFYLDLGCQVHFHPKIIPFWLSWH